MTTHQQNARLGGGETGETQLHRGRQTITAAVQMGVLLG